MARPFPFERLQPSVKPPSPAGPRNRRIDARRTDATSRLNLHGLNFRAFESGDPVCRSNPAFAISYRLSAWPALPAFLSYRQEPCSLGLFRVLLSGFQWQRGALISGRFRAGKLVGSGRYSKRFFARSAFLPEGFASATCRFYYNFLASRARGTPLRSGRGGAGARPAAAKSAATGPDCAAPSSTATRPPGASSAGAATAIAR